MERPITALQIPDCDWLLHRIIEVNFSKLTDSNQIFRNAFVGFHYHLCKISSKIIECIIFIHTTATATGIGVLFTDRGSKELNLKLFPDCGPARGLY